MRARLVVTIDGIICGFLLTAFAVLALAAPVRDPAGTLDPSFGQGGEVIVQPNPACASGCVESIGSHAEALALVPDGSIILAGNSSLAGAGGQRSWLVRLEPNGAPDQAFGAAGYAEGERGLAISRVTVSKTGAALALVTKAAGGRGFGLERFTPAGTVDASFGTKGVRWVSSAVEDQVERVFDSQGRIVVLGEVHGGPAVARYLPSGELDTKFGHHGIAKLGVLGDATPLRLATEPTGAIVVAGYGASAVKPVASRVLLARLTNSGAPDRGFGRQGVVEASRAFAGSVDALAITPHHGIVLASSTLRSSGPQRTDKLLVARYTSKGPDASFGVGGVSERTHPASSGAGLLIHAIATDGSGDAVIVGEHRERSVDVPRGNWFVARYTPHGRDCSFGSGGSVEGMDGGANAVTIQPDGRIVIAGWGPSRPGFAAGTGFLAARYIGGGAGGKCSEAISGS